MIQLLLKLSTMNVSTHSRFTVSIAASNSSRFWVLICIVWLAIGCTSAWSQSPAALFEDGPLQDVSEQMNKFLRLKIVNGKLELRRDWGEDKGQQQDQQDKIDQETDRLIARGFDEGTAARLAERIARTDASESPFTAAFFALSRLRSGSSQRTFNGTLQKVKFRNSDLSADAQMEVSNKDMQLKFVERKPPNRQLSLAQLQNGEFIFRYSNPDFKVELHQKNSGIELKRKINDQTEQFQSLTFDQLRRQNPELVDQWLLPVMSHAGITLPVLSENTEIIAAVFARLESFSQKTDQFERLVRQLNAPDYETRNRAAAMINANRKIWKGQIELKLEQVDLPLETRVSLQSSLEQQDPQSQMDELIRDQNLLNSPDYLVSLFDSANSKQTGLVIKRLQQVTGKSFSQPDQWRAWLKTEQERIASERNQSKAKPDS